MGVIKLNVTDMNMKRFTSRWGKKTGEMGFQNLRVHEKTIKKTTTLQIERKYNTNIKFKK